MPSIRHVVTVVLTLAGAVGAAQADDFVKMDSGGDAVVNRDIAVPLSAQRITQSADPNTIVGGTSVFCSGAGVSRDTGWWRLFDLDGGHGLTGVFCVESIDYAIELASGPVQNLTANVYCLEDDLPFLVDFLTPVGSNSVPQPDASLEFFNIEVGGCCDAQSRSLAVELRSDDCAETGTCNWLAIGMNDLGEFASTYITAPDCGIFDPMADSFQLWHLIMVVNGEGEPADDPGGGASTLGAVQEAKLVPDDVSSGFAGSVALDGHTALIGARTDDDNGDRAGSAYVFVRSNGVWFQQAELLASDGADDDFFGSAVALDGDTALIGAPRDTDNGFDSGSAYVFTRTGGIWTQQAKLVPADGDADDDFGSDVALHGDTALVSASGDEDNGDNSGSVYVFVRSGGVWSQQAKLLASDGDSGDRFGSDVALSGDTALVGASLDDDIGGFAGSAYVFSRTGGAWSEQAKLLAPDADDGDIFGYSVALDGDTAVVAARGDDHNGYDAGSVYVITRDGGVWTQQAKLAASDAYHGDEFGHDVADGETVVVGA